MQFIAISHLYVIFQDLAPVSSHCVDYCLSATHLQTKGAKLDCGLNDLLSIGSGTRTPYRGSHCLEQANCISYLLGLIKYKKISIDKQIPSTIHVPQRLDVFILLLSLRIPIQYTGK